METNKKIVKYPPIRNKHNKLTERWIAVVSSCVIMVLMLLTFRILYSQIHRVSDTVQELSNHQLEKMADQVKGIYGNYTKLFNILSSSEPLSRYSAHNTRTAEDLLDRDGYDLQKNMIALMGVYGENINTLAVYFEASDSVITMSRHLLTGSTDAFFETYPEVSPEKLTEMEVGTFGHNYFLHSGKHNWIIRRVVKTGTESIYLLLEFSLKDALSGMSANSGDLLIFSGNQEECYFSNGEIPEPQAYQTLIEETKKKGSFELEQTYLSKCLYLSISDICIITALPFSNIKGIDQRFSVILFISAILVVMCLIVMLGSLNHRIFLPLEGLFSNRKQGDKALKDALESLSEDFESMEKNRNQLLRERNVLLPSALGRCFVQIAEKGESQESLKLAGSSLLMANIPMSHRFAVFSILCEEKNAIRFGETNTRNRSHLSDLYFSLNNSLKELLFEQCPGVIAPVGPESFTVLVSFPAEENRDIVTRALRQLVSDYQENEMIILHPTTVGIGNNAQDLVRLVANQIDEMSYYDFWGESNVVSDELDKNADNPGFYSYCNMIRRTIGKLSAHNYEEIWAELKQILGQAIPKEDDVRNTRYRMFTMTSFIVTAIEEQLNGERAFIEENAFEARLFDVQNITDYRNELKKILQEVVEHKEIQEKSIFINGRMEDVHKYLMNHFMDNAISVTSVAQEFGISVSYLSRSFKESFDVNLLEYIQKLRIDEAKKLLSDHSVQETAQMVGFWDTQSLTRTFKKFEGIAPGDYKRLLKKEQTW